MTTARRFCCFLLLASCFLLLLSALLAGNEPAFFEPWLLRFARSISLHPSRSSLALALILLAAAPPAESKAEPGRGEHG